MTVTHLASPAPYDPTPHEHLHPAFGDDRFGRAAENVARALGTPQYILGQTIVVFVWIAINAAAVSLHWDPYPFILLNLAFSTQAAYAAPLILLAQTRAAERTRALEDAAAEHRDQLASAQQLLLEQNTRLTEEAAKLARQIEVLTVAIHRRVIEHGGTATPH
jgi:uncharacterized membrane protein